MSHEQKENFDLRFLFLLRAEDRPSSERRLVIASMFVMLAVDVKI